jgi:hypothetical protein
MPTTPESEPTPAPTLVIRTVSGATYRLDPSQFEDKSLEPPTDAPIHHWINYAWHKLTIQKVMFVGSGQGVVYAKFVAENVESISSIRR